MTEQEKSTLYNVILQLIDCDETLKKQERRDLMNQLTYARCNMNVDEILAQTQNNRKLRVKRGTTAQNDEYVGLAGELTMDTDENTLRIHDGQTPGGHPVGGDTELPNNLSDIAFAMMPDYSQATPIPGTGTYVAETNLYLQGHAKLIWSANPTIKILDESDNVLMTYIFKDDDINAIRYMPFSIVVPRGCKYSIAQGGNGLLIGSVIPFICG